MQVKAKDDVDLRNMLYSVDMQWHCSGQCYSGRAVLGKWVSELLSQWLQNKTLRKRGRGFYPNLQLRTELVLYYNLLSADKCGLIQGG